MPLPIPQIKKPIPQRKTNVAVNVPAPIGGINTVSVAGAMPPSDCLQLFNLIPQSYGLRVRSGWREWTTGMKVNYQGRFTDTLLLSDRYSVAHT